MPTDALPRELVGKPCSQGPRSARTPAISAQDEEHRAHLNAERTLIGFESDTFMQMRVRANECVHANARACTKLFVHEGK